MVEERFNVAERDSRASRTPGDQTYRFLVLVELVQGGGCAQNEFCACVIRRNRGGLFNRAPLVAIRTFLM